MSHQMFTGQPMTTLSGLLSSSPFSPPSLSTSFPILWVHWASTHQHHLTSSSTASFVPHFHLFFQVEYAISLEISPFHRPSAENCNSPRDSRRPLDRGPILKRVPPSLLSPRLHISFSHFHRLPFEKCSSFNLVRAV
jgi:hypothetical protein